MRGHPPEDDGDDYGGLAIADLVLWECTARAEQERHGAEPRDENPRS